MTSGRWTSLLVATLAGAGLWIGTTIPTANAAEAPKKPFLKIEAGMHIAGIRRVDVSDDGRMMITSSEDKTARIWSLPDGKLQRILRVPVGPANEGKIYAAALSPDGLIAAVGGWDVNYVSEDDPNVHIYLFNTKTGEMLTRIGPLRNVVNDIEFSPDGTRLAATVWGSNGTRLWRTSDWKMIASDKDYKDSTYGIDYSTHGRMATASYDGNIRIYDLNLNLLRKHKSPDDLRPYNIKYSPDNRKMAVLYESVNRIDVLNSETMELIKTLDTKGTTAGFWLSAIWLENGSLLCACGGNIIKGGGPVSCWAEGGIGKRSDYNLSDNTIMDLKNMGPTGFVLGAQDPAIGIYDVPNQQNFWRGPEMADMRGKHGKHFTISADASEVRFGLKTFSTDPWIFNIDRLNLEAAPSVPPHHIQAINKGMPIKNWSGSRTPAVGNTVLELDPYEVSRSLAIDLGTETFVLGADWSLRRFNSSGEEFWRKHVPNVAWGVHMSRDGRVIVAAYGDGTIRWHRASDGQELLALFVHAKDQRWILWSPTGYYATSPGGEELIGWHVNRGLLQPPDFFPASRFRDQFYRPDIVQAVLTYLDEGTAVKEINRKAKRRDEPKNILDRLPPVIDILSPSHGTEFNGTSINVRYKVRSPSGLPITKIEVLLDGRPLSAQGIAPGVPIKASAKGTQGEFEVPMPSRDIQIALVARTAQATSVPAAVAVKFSGAITASTENFAKPKLYALAIGISNYDLDDYKLRYAAQDALDMAEAFKRQAGGVYREVVVKTLVDQDATADNILDALTWLEGEVTSRDVGLVFLAGHGITDIKQRFYYLPVNGNPDRLRSTAVSQADFQETLASLAGKALFFIDACYSAASIEGEQTRGLSRVDITGVVNELTSAENGVVMFASSTGRQLSIERDEWQNGAFTEAVLEGFAGKADYSKDGAISIGEMDLWISERVKQLTDKRQHPVGRRPSTVPDFPFALVR